MAKAPRLSWRLKIGIALAPWICMVVLNETVRWSNSERFEKLGISVLNNSEPNENACSWYCHYRTDYCKEHHTRWAKTHFNWIDPVYFGIIKLLGSTGNYGLANIVFLVVAWPLLMYILLLRVIANRKRIKTLKLNE